MYGVSLADCDWLHGSAESLLTITNLVTVVAFRQAFQGKEFELDLDDLESSLTEEKQRKQPLSVTSYQPMVMLVAILTFIAGLTAFIPAMNHPEVHTPYLNGFLDLPKDWLTAASSSSNGFIHEEPSNALSVGWYVFFIGFKSCFFYLFNG